MAGVNQYISEARSDPSKLPAEYPALGKLPADWKGTDTVAIASLIGGIFGKGGGGEAKAAQALLAARERFGAKRARSVFRDFRAFDEPEAPVTTTKRFRFDRPGRVKSAAVALPDLGSIKDRDPVVADGGGPSPGVRRRRSPACPTSRSAGCRSSACSPTRCWSRASSPGPGTRSPSWARRSATTRPRS